MIEEKICRSRVQKLHGSYQFQVEGYSSLPNRVGDSVESPEFLLCEHLWQLRIFPNGSLEQHKGYISFYLASKSDRVARASYTLTIVNQIIGGDDESFSSTAVRLFEPKGDQVDGWGRDRFVEAEMLKNSEFGLCVNDIALFKVEITVHGSLEIVSDKDSTHPPSYLQRNDSLQKALKEMFCKNIFTDANIVVVEEAVVRVIPVHRCILMARSEVFRNMFTANMSESMSGEVMIYDISYEIMYELLMFMYTDNYPDRKFLEQNAVSLLRACQKYQFHGLSEVCQLYLCDYLRVESVLSMLIFADEMTCTYLKQKCLMFIAQNSKRISNSPEINELSIELKHEMMQMIETNNRKKGCRRLNERKSTYNVNCNLM